MKDKATVEIVGHIKISDPDTGRVFVDKRTTINTKQKVSNERPTQTNNSRPFVNKG